MTGIRSPRPTKNTQTRKCLSLNSRELNVSCNPWTCRHISTLIGIITASIYYPLRQEPVRIYLTNPIHKNAWEKILKFWFKVLRTSKPEPTIDIENPTTCTKEHEELMNDLLMYSDEVRKLQNSPVGRAFLALSPNTRLVDRCFQFYCLNPNNSFGAIRISSHKGISPVEENIINLENQAWEQITPHDPGSEAFLHHHYTADFTMVGSVSAQYSDDTVTRLEFRENGEIVLKLIDINNNAPPSTPMSIEEGSEGGSVSHLLNYCQASNFKMMNHPRNANNFMASWNTTFNTYVSSCLLIHRRWSLTGSKPTEDSIFPEDIRRLEHFLDQGSERCDNASFDG